MSSFSFGEQLAGIVRQERATMTLQDQVAQLFQEARDDVYRYLLSLGLYPPQAQEGAQEVFLRLYATLKKGENIQNPRAWIFRVAHNLGLKIRARQNNQAPFDADLESQILAPELNPEQSLLEREKNLRVRRDPLASGSLLAVPRRAGRTAEDGGRMRTLSEERFAAPSGSSGSLDRHLPG